jgi:pimeloyl-ACP methyl ester carboxylesterase
LPGAGGTPMRSVTAALVTIALGLAVAPGPAGAAEPYTAVRGAPAPGPSRYDKVFVQRFGPARAKRVLVLVPGYIGGAGDFRLVAREIVRRVPGLQVWAYDRREQAFEDTSGFTGGDPVKAQATYLGFKFKRVLPAQVPYVADWGLKVALEDLRRVVRKARAGGRRKVILGGHSLGASTAVAYASWDFHGRPGYRDINGLVLIDGGLLGTFGSTTAAQARKELTTIRKGAVFSDLLGLGIPEAAGFLPQLAALYAKKNPTGVSPVQQSPIVPSRFKPPFAVTNEGALGYAFDRDTSPPELSLIQIDGGRLAPAGNPRPWVDGGLTPIQRFATVFAADRPNAAEWYFPRRLTLDVGAAGALRRTAATRLLGLGPFHTGGIRVPLYAFQTSLTKGRVLRGARRLVKRSHIRTATYVSDPRQSHLDPLVASPARNRFLTTVVRFLKRPALR